MREKTAKGKWERERERERERKGGREGGREETRKRWEWIKLETWNISPLGAVAILRAISIRDVVIDNEHTLSLPNDWEYFRFFSYPNSSTLGPAFQSSCSFFIRKSKRRLSTPAVKIVFCLSILIHAYHAMYQFYSRVRRRRRIEIDARTTSPKVNREWRGDLKTKSRITIRELNGSRFKSEMKGTVSKPGRNWSRCWFRGVNGTAKRGQVEWLKIVRFYYRWISKPITLSPGYAC